MINQRIILFRRLDYQISLLVFTILGLILANLSLANLLGYEFCAILAVAISFVAPYLTIRWMKDYPTADLYSLFRAFFIHNWILQIPPVIVITLNALRIKNCNFSNGILLFLLLPTISCLHAVTAGLFFGAKFDRSNYTKYLYYIAASYILLLKNIILDPPIFAYHATFGYFPGPIYDEKIPITKTLIWARISTVVLSLIFLYLANRSWAKLTAHKLNAYRVSKGIWNRRPFFIALVCVLGAFYVFRGPLGIRPTRNYIEEKLGGEKETDHFVIFYQKGSIVEQEIEAIAADHEFRYKQLSEYLQTKPKQKIRSYIYTSAQQKKQLMGAEHTAVEDPFGYGFHINYASFPHPILMHEMAHVFTIDWQPLLKVSPRLGLHEGIAVAAEWNEGRLTAHQWSQAMNEADVAPSISQIMGFGFWLHSGQKSYTLAGSFVRYLVDQYGIEKFKQVFRWGNFEDVYEQSLSSLESEWRFFLSSVKLSEFDKKIAQNRFQAPSIFQKTCVHEIADLSSQAWSAYNEADYLRAERLFQRINQHIPNHPKYLRGSMLSVYQQSKFKVAHRIAVQIIFHTKSTLALKVEAENLIGNMYWKQGKIEFALKYYQSVAKNMTSERLKREAIAKIDCLINLENPIKLRSVLLDNIPDRLRMTFLHEIRSEMPDWPLPDYLIGRQLYLDGSIKKAIQYLSSAVSNTTLHPIFRREANRIMGQGAYQLKEFGFAREKFEQILLDGTLSDGKRLIIQDWINRCDWHQLSQKP